MPHHHLCLRGLGGSWHGRAPRREVVLAVDGPAESKRAARLSTSSSARLDRWGSGGSGGGGGGGAGGAVVVGRSHAAQVPAVQGVHGLSSTECWTFQLRTERYPQCKLCRRLFLVSTSL